MRCTESIAEVKKFLAAHVAVAPVAAGDRRTG
jgi:hypothetical protein